MLKTQEKNARVTRTSLKGIYSEEKKKTEHNDMLRMIKKNNLGTGSQLSDGVLA